MEMSARGRAALAASGLSALLFAVGCAGTREAGGVLPQAPGEASATQSGLPIVVSCEPTQRTIVRPTVVNGVAMSQVECVAGAPAPMAVSQPIVAAPVPQVLATPVSYRTALADPTPVALEDTQVVPAATRTVARPVRAAQVVDDAPRVQRRSVKKSAVIIGSSAGIGAGDGAAVGGRKGALIGAAIGGGSATLWDQITRRRD